MNKKLPHPAMAVRCPKCGADPGAACRNYRGGAMAPHTHRRRIAHLTSLAEEANALCRRHVEEQP